MISLNYWIKSRALLLSVCVLLLSGCSMKWSRPVEVTVETKQDRQIICQQAPDADSIAMRDVVPVPVRDAAGLMWVGFSARDYANMSLNLQDMLTHMEQQNAVVRYYEECINAENKRRFELGKGVANE